MAKSLFGQNQGTLARYLLYARVMTQLVNHLRWPQRLSTLLLVTVLAACTSPGRVTHVDQHAEHVGVKVVSIVTQSDVAAADDEHARSLVSQPVAKFEFNNNKRTQAQPPNLALRDALAVVDVRGELAKNLSTDLAKGAPFSITSLEPRQAPFADLDRELHTLGDSGLLVLDTVYYLTANLRALRVETRATLYSPAPPAKTKKGKPTEAPLPIITYSNTLVVHQEVLPAHSKKPQDYWMLDEGRVGIDALRFALRETARLLIWDINDQQQPAKAFRRAATFPIASPDRTGNTEIKGSLVMETVARYLVRSSNGQLYSLPNPNYREPTTGP